MRERLSTFKGMAEAVWDAGNRKIGDASQTGCTVTETHPDRTTTTRTKRPQKNQTTHPNPYVPLPGVWLSGGRLCCQWSLQSVARCFRRTLSAETVADYSQTVAIGCRMRKSAASVSRGARAIPFLNEGAIGQNRWIRMHRRAAEKQTRTWSTCAPSFPSNRPRVPDRLPRRGEKLKLGWRGE
jgi:hypothetical protein